MSQSCNQSFDLLSILKISGAFVAFLIGSGFATGQESMQFFVAHGYQGIIGALIVLAFFIYLCTTFMSTGKRLNFKCNEDAFKHYCGNVIGTGLTWYTMVFIVAVHAIMMAGAGATLNESYGIHPYIGSGIMALASMITLLFGLKKIVDVIGTIGPLIIILSIAVGIMTLMEHADHIHENVKAIPEMGLLSISDNWLMSCLLYVGLNVPGLACFLPALGTTAPNQKDIHISAIIGPLFFIGALIIIAFALISNITHVDGKMIPVMALASDVLPLYGSIFAIIIFLGIYTTATPLLWTVVTRFSEEKTRKYHSLVVVLTMIGYIGGLTLPFNKLVNIIYPTVGYAGLLFLSLAVITDTKIWLKRKN